jgi:hypothetical protein
LGANSGGMVDVHGGDVFHFRLGLGGDENMIFQVAGV